MQSNSLDMPQYSSSTLKASYGPLHDFFIDGLKDIMWAEKSILPVLQSLMNQADAVELTDAIEDHYFQSQKHISRLEKIFNHLAEKVETKKCEAAAGIIKEMEEIVKKTPEKSSTRDAIIILALQKFEHYEIASYGGLCQIAVTFNMDQVANMLEQTLMEEEETDLLLSDIAECYINLEAAQETGNSVTASAAKEEQATQKMGTAAKTVK